MQTALWFRLRTTNINNKTKTIYKKMVGTSIKKNRLYYLIRDFNFGNQVESHFHVDYLSGDFNIPKRKWDTLVLEAYNLATSYIEKKQYHIHVYIGKYVRLKDNFERLSTKDIKPDYIPDFIILSKNEIKSSDIDATYSNSLSSLYRIPVCKWHNPNDKNNMWYLYMGLL